MARTVTLKDIARKTNLSVASVSKALAGYPHVSQATQARVRAASDKLNYRPRVQRNTAKAKPRVKCLATEDWIMQSGQWLAALAMASGQCNVQLEESLISGTTAASHPGHAQPNQIDNWHKAINDQSHHADGILLFGCFVSAELQAMEQLKLPFVVVGDMPFQGVNLSLPVHSVTTNKLAMGKYATDRLIEQGHEHIGFFCGKYPPGGWNEQWYHGYQLALRDAGRVPQPQHCQIINAPVSKNIGSLAAMAMSKAKPLPTAIVTPSILGGACFKQTFLKLGLPLSQRQMALGGRHDEAVAMGMSHALLINEPVEAMAIHAIDLLTRVIANPTLPSSQVIVPFEVSCQRAD